MILYEEADMTSVPGLINVFAPVCSPAVAQTDHQGDLPSFTVVLARILLPFMDTGSLCSCDDLFFGSNLMRQYPLTTSPRLMYKEESIFLLT